jgi:SAM-dependent methyltransferase
VELPFGSAHVFYPQLGQERSKAALLLDIDPVGLVRGRADAVDASLRQYVNDRPYASSSFMSVALARVLGTTMSGRSKERQDLADTALEWEATVTAVPCRGESELLDRLFAPLGYKVEAKHYNLDDHFPEWGPGPYHTIRLINKLLLRDLLTHLYVLLPVLDGDKHYWIGEEEVDPDDKEAEHAQEEEKLESGGRLWEQRMAAVSSALRARQVQTVLDVGCGEGKLMKLLLGDQTFTKITGLDVSVRVLQKAARKLRFEQLPPTQKARIDLIHGSLMYRDKRLSGYDAATVVEVIEHLDPPRLAAFERVLFEHARPRVAIVTTPNVEYNPLFGTLAAGAFRHKDHRFEWTRAEFQSWAFRVAERFNYKVEFAPVGPADQLMGPPTQMAVFER